MVCSLPGESARICDVTRERIGKLLETSIEDLHHLIELLI